MQYTWMMHSKKDIYSIVLQQHLVGNKMLFFLHCPPAIDWSVSLRHHHHHHPTVNDALKYSSESISIKEIVQYLYTKYSLFGEQSLYQIRY